MLLIVFLAACAPATADSTNPIEQEVTEPVESETGPELPDMGEAPPIEGEIWLNVDEPLQWEELRGQVVLVEMWTFGCINCRRVIPHLSEWHQRYADQGLVIIGNHYPEFPHERDLCNLKDAIQRLEVRYPVVQDNERLNWGRYNNHYWPTLYLVDKQGHVRYQHIGEGAYELTESAIEALLAEPAGGVSG
jgi:thiol-disulfide isomerase/thioredoxin